MPSPARSHFINILFAILYRLANMRAKLFLHRFTITRQSITVLLVCVSGCHIRVASTQPFRVSQLGWENAFSVIVWAQRKTAIVHYNLGALFNVSNVVYILYLFFTIQWQTNLNGKTYELISYTKRFVELKFWYYIHRNGALVFKSACDTTYGFRLFGF